MNKVHLIGNLTRDPETRSTQSGVTVCNFTIAVNRRFKNAQTGEQETDFLNIVAWRQLGELCKQYLSKGKKVAVFGSIQTRNYEDKNGNKRTSWDIIADEVEFLSPAENKYAKKTSDAPEQVKPAAESFTQVEDEELPF